MMKWETIYTQIKEGEIIIIDHWTIDPSKYTSDGL